MEEDKRIQDLTAASEINDNDYFVLEQDGEAMKLMGELLKDYINRNIMSVTVSQLPAGSQPTVSFNTQTGALSLGIPKGDTGPPGPRGPAGPSGPGTGDMLASVYDPDGNVGDVGISAFVEDAITVISALIPQQASASNQLADKNFVNSSVQTATANFRGNWATWTAVPTDARSYPLDYSGTRTPTTNDYMVVADASTVPYTDPDTEEVTYPYEGTWRFKYGGVWATDNRNGWNAEYQVNEEPLTAAQLAALNSNITDAKRQGYDSHVADGTIHVTAADKATWNGKTAIPKIGEIRLLANNWTDNGSFFTQSVTVSGHDLSITNNSKIDILPIATLISQMVDDGCTAIFVENDDSVLTVYAIGNKVSGSWIVPVCVTEVTT